MTAPGVNPSANAVYAVFQTLLPHIQTRARLTFRDVSYPGHRADRVAEFTALAWKWPRRLHQRGKDVMPFSMLFIRLIVRGVRCGRRLGHQERAQDVLSPVAQHWHGFKVEPLATAPGLYHKIRSGPGDGQRQLDACEERLRDNAITPPPDAAAFRIDFPRFVGGLSGRERELARFLSLGNSARGAAAAFGLSPPRVTQLRQRWCREWRAFQGEDAAAAVPAPATAAR
jgi:hypothetical protein